MKAYAAYYDNQIRLESSSGGIFSVVASKFDVVYGVAMTSDCYGAEFVRTEKDIYPLRGSKYLQAKVGEAFKNVKTDLENGKKVLFSGTGCQINGLRCFLQKDYPNLFLLDVICHGAPSPLLWKKYVMQQEKRHGKLKNVKFRCKNVNYVKRKKDSIFIPKDKDKFMQMFLKDYCLRPSCYECHAKNYKLSDMTIADFWGIESVSPGMNDGKGTSLVITRTDKGQSLFDDIKNSLKWHEVSYEDGVRNNPCEFKSVKRPDLRDSFFKNLHLLSFKEMEHKYAPDIKENMKTKIKRIIKAVIRRVIEGKTKSNDNYGMLLTFGKSDK